ncbi:MAG: HAMP domain-containing protein [Chloroflexi bacterium]|nr:MAG: HAMP domain-containing protein [Chloroflexota bacterium]
MSIGSLFTPSIRRTLLSRTMLIAIVPIILIGTLAIWLSQDLLQARFNDEAQIVAAAIANGIADRITLAQRGSAVLAALPEARDLTIARDASGLRELLIPLKSRLALDLAFVCDPTGTIIAGAQDFKAGDTLPPELVARVRAHAEASYVIYSEPRGLMIRAISPISSSTPQSAPGYVETGSLLDNSFITTLRASSDSEIAIIVDRQVKVSTIPINSASIPAHSDTDLLLGPVYRETTIKGQRYQAIFTLVQSHSSQPQELGVFLPLAPLDNAQREIALAIAGGGLVLATLAFALSYRTARTLTQPLARLAGAAQRIEQGDLAVRVAGGSPHEIGQLEHSFGSMAGALRTRDARNEALVNDLRAANVKLEELSRLKSEFIANVSHELRTPMNAILGYTDFMLEGLNGPLTKQQESDLGRVRAAAHNLLGIINGLLDLAKIEAGQMDVAPERFSIEAVAREVVDLLGERARAKGLALRSEIDPSVPMAWADPIHARQVLTNLAGNAVKFTNAGEVVIDAAVQGNMLELVVRDTGEGIAPEAQAYIFDEFRQADGSARRKHGGTGLGLAIARRLVWMNGGKIWVQSEPGVGSRFYFTLPLESRATRAPERAATVTG